MRNLKVLSAVLVVAVIMGIPATAPAMGNRAGEPAFVPDQVLVRFNDEVSRARIGEIVEEEGGVIGRVLGSTGVYLIELPGGTDVPDAVRRFSEHPEVRYAEPNFKVERLQR